MAGEKRLGTNEVVFNRIFASESFGQLKLVFEEYYKLTGHDIEKAVKSEMSGDVERAFLAVGRQHQHLNSFRLVITCIQMRILISLYLNCIIT